MNALTDPCSATCYGETCQKADDQYGTVDGFCDYYGVDIQLVYGCDCSGCACDDSTSAPTVTPVNCATAADGTLCDDGDATTTNDICSTGLCQGVQMTCYTLSMFDSWGDGWQGNTWHWVDTGGGDTTGFLTGGSSGTTSLCFTGSSCYTFYVSDSGDYPSEISWTVTDPSGTTLASVGTVHLKLYPAVFLAAALQGH